MSELSETDPVSIELRRVARAAIRHEGAVMGLGATRVDAVFLSTRHGAVSLNGRG